MPKSRRRLGNARSAPIGIIEETPAPTPAPTPEPTPEPTPAPTFEETQHAPSRFPRRDLPDFTSQFVDFNIASIPNSGDTPRITRNRRNRGNRGNSPGRQQNIQYNTPISTPFATPRNNIHVVDMYTPRNQTVPETNETPYPTPRIDRDNALRESMRSPRFEELRKRK